jgi:ATP-dependent phosphofructokinase / diphosphate-dependent phosphofructokinase
LRRGDDGAPHLFLIPERPFARDSFLALVEATLSRVGYCVVAAAETIRDAGGAYVAQSSAGQDRFGHPIVTAVGETLAQLVAGELDVKARANKPGTLQRTSVPYLSPIDAEEAYQAGRAAAERLAEGQTGEMVTFERRSDEPYRVELGAVALTKVANGERTMPAPLLVETNGNVTSLSDAFRRYAAPLIGPAPEPHFALA